MDSGRKKIGLFLAMALAAIAVIVFLTKGGELVQDTEAFSDGITGNQAVREGTHIKQQVRDIRDEHRRMIDDAVRGDR